MGERVEKRRRVDKGEENEQRLWEKVRSLPKLSFHIKSIETIERLMIRLRKSDGPL